MKYSMKCNYMYPNLIESPVMGKCCIRIRSFLRKAATRLSHKSSI